MMNEEMLRLVMETVSEHWGDKGRGTLRILRERFPGILFVAVPEEDVLEEPVGRAGDVGIHLIRTTDHCVSVVSDSCQAGGVLLAVKE
ncbi:hypothetical protein [Leptospirillum ferriphilum]|uniref:hypothetical protein n=1 Tax=Leptospirillum ferriphilum TaxID=178606 RepID=UPI0006B22E98|nr:hypothetical protein [Leptospirillum ferriphilum]